MGGRYPQLAAVGALHGWLWARLFFLKTDQNRMQSDFCLGLASGALQVVSGLESHGMVLNFARVGIVYLALDAHHL